MWFFLIFIILSLKYFCWRPPVQCVSCCCPYVHYDCAPVFPMPALICALCCALVCPVLAPLRALYWPPCGALVITLCRLLVYLGAFMNPMISSLCSLCWHPFLAYYVGADMCLVFTPICFCTAKFPVCHPCEQSIDAPVCPVLEPLCALFRRPSVCLVLASLWFADLWICLINTGFIPRLPASTKDVDYKEFCSGFASIILDCLKSIRGKKTSKPTNCYVEVCLLS